MIDKIETGMRVTVVDSGTDALRQVIALGDRNTRFLGHFPESAFQREAGKGRILAAMTDDSRVAGYVMYRTARDRAVVQHLCIDSSLRRNGIGTRLIDELKKRTCHLPVIVSHVALEFEEAIKAWQRFGFVPMGEKPGRGKTQRPLIRLVFDHGHANLFTGLCNIRAIETLVAAVDLNIALALHDSPETDAEIMALKSDWLLEEVSLWITDESMAEVTRQGDPGERQRRTAELRSMLSLTRDPSREKELKQELRQMMFSGSQRVQDISDAAQLAQAIAGDADVFLTRDERILRHADGLEARFSMQVMRPSDLVVQLDEIAHRDDYAPVRLHGSIISAHPIRKTDIDAVIDQFLNSGAGEHRHRLAEVIRTYVSALANSQVLVVEGGIEGFRAVLGFTWGSADELRVGLLRVRKDRLSETLTRHLLSYAVRESILRGCSVTVIDEPYPTRPIVDASVQVGFVRGQHAPVKWSGAGLLSRGELLDQIRRCVDTDPSWRQPLAEVVSIAQRNPPTPEDDLVLERLAWPTLLRGSRLRTFVVPIQPRFAAHLFDRRLGERELFGGDPALLLNCENVYYKSSHVPVVSAPARILWYVSADNRETVQELRAFSPVLATEVGSAKNLFNKFKRLGVYGWRDMVEMTDGNSAGEVMAIHFGLSEMLVNPINGDRLRDLIAHYRQSLGRSPLSMPIEIPPACFERIIEISNGK